MRERIFRDVDIRRQLIRLPRLRTPLGNTSGNRHVASNIQLPFQFSPGIAHRCNAYLEDLNALFFFHTFPRYIPLPSYYTFHSVYFLISFVHFLFHSCSNCTDRGGVIGCCEIKIDANTYRISELSLEMQLIPKFKRITFGHVHPTSRHTIVLFLTYLSS